MAHHRQFLVTDSDSRARTTLASLLTDRMDCGTTEAECAADARALLGRRSRFDAVFLDNKLPDGDARDICRELRASGFAAPIIVLAQSARESDVVWALDAGASDYVAKPFRPAELLARVRAQLRAFDVSEYAEIPIGPFVFHTGARTLVHSGGGRPTRLTDKEASLLKHLYRAAGRAVSRETLLREVWGYCGEAATHTVETHVYRLRRKIEWPGVAGRLLTSEGGSYRLNLDVGRPAAWPRVQTTAAVLAMAAGAD